MKNKKVEKLKNKKTEERKFHSTVWPFEIDQLEKVSGPGFKKAQLAGLFE